MSVPPHVKIMASSVTGRMGPYFEVPNQISKDNSPILFQDIVRIIYNSNPAEFEDKVDGDCVMNWDQAQHERPQELEDAFSKARELVQSRIPQAELIKFIGKDGLLGEMADFTWYHGTDWLVETRFGNFHWKDPDYADGDNSFTFYEGNHIDFSYTIHVGFGRSKGRNLILNRCGPDIELRIPQLDN